MSTSLAPDSQKASKVNPFTQRMINSTNEKILTTEDTEAFIFLWLVLQQWTVKQETVLYIKKISLCVLCVLCG